MIDEKKLIEAIVNTPSECLDSYSVSSVQQGIQYGCATRQNEIIDIIEEQPKADCSECTRREWYQKGYQDGLNADKWIPFEQREADEEEKEYWLENYGQEIEYMLCGRLPDEEEEIIVSYSNGCVGEDIFMRDGTDCYLDSGNELVTEAIAWMPKPQPYKKEGAE